MLVYDPFSPNASPSPDDKKKHLDDVSKELNKLAKEAGEVKSESIAVEKRWHEAVVGQSGTTLNAYVVLSLLHTKMLKSSQYHW